MTRRRIAGICIGVLGVIMLVVAAYINKQVEQGREEVTSAEQKVGQGKFLLNLTPVTSEIGQKTIVDPAERKIAAGQEELSKYQTLANRLQIGGIILIVAGIIISLLPSKQEKKPRG